MAVVHKCPGCQGMFVWQGFDLCPMCQDLYENSGELKEEEDGR